MSRAIALSLLFSLAASLNLYAVEQRVEPLKEGPPAEGLAPEVAAKLSTSGARVVRGPKTNFCDIWLCKELPVTADFKPTAEVLYPFQMGQLIGVVKYARKGADFRDQDIPAGLYTLRYAQQPVDGNHVGTSLTRDFFLLTKADKDASPEPLDFKKLAKQSAEAAGSSHPLLLSMQKAAGESDPLPAIRHDEEREWWIVRLAGQAKGGETSKPLAIEFVIVGKAAE